MRSVSLSAQPTAAQRRAQDSTVAILRRYCDEAEAHLRARAVQQVERLDARLCPCGIALGECMCPLRQTR